MSLRVLVASGGYKEGLRAEAVVEAIACGVRRAAPDLTVAELALADGGEGTVTTLQRMAGGEIHTRTVTTPDGGAVEARYAILSDGRAVIELAEAAGLQQIDASATDLLQTSSRGVGELIEAALDRGARHIVIGCGDSGINDGGAGLCRALGARLLDANGDEIAEGGIGLCDLTEIDDRSLDPRLAETTIEVACNTENILTGEHGVARVFGPQKGADDDTVDTLAQAMQRWADIIERDCGHVVAELPGGGASGGCGAGLAGVLGAHLVSRFEYLFPLFQVDDAIQNADLILTAEGGLDYKSANGKIPAELGRRGAAAGKPVIVLAGIVDPTAEVILDEGVHAYFSISERPQSIEEAIQETSTALEHISEHLIRTFLAGVVFGRLGAGNTNLGPHTAAAALDSADG
ncbi:glycerate kinase [Salinisphaera sp. SPP-AMP-43]|uniref:glycerate kinase family protein n=1 Tax=Salinisphaera sp. SPP-AMP-43 TaxID=3121288 RepID=UPI003C6E3836